MIFVCNGDTVLQDVSQELPVVFGLHVCLPVCSIMFWWCFNSSM